MKQDARYMVNSLKDKKAAFLDEKQEIKKTAEDIDELCKELIDDAKCKSGKTRKIVKCLMYAVLVLIAAVVTVLFAIGTWKISDLSNASLFRSYIYVGVITIICLVMSVVSIVKWVSKYVNRLSEMVYDHCYTKNLKRFEKVLKYYRK